MIKKNRILFTLLSLILGINSANAQDGIDTALFKQLQVKKMWVYVKLPLLPHKTMNDSCKSESYEIDTLGRTVYENHALSCMGWSGSHEIYTTYDSLNRTVLSKKISDGDITYSRFIYNSKNDVEKVIQSSPDRPDSLFTTNHYTYDPAGKVINLRVVNRLGPDTSVYFVKYEYDTADNIKNIWTYTSEMQLIQKQTFDFTPQSKKLLEFSTETKLPKQSFTRGWNYYNFDAQLSRTQYSNNTWTEFVYGENGLLEQALNYNMEGKLNSFKTYHYEFYERHK